MGKKKKKEKSIIDVVDDLTMAYYDGAYFSTTYTCPECDNLLFKKIYPLSEWVDDEPIISVIPEICPYCGTTLWEEPKAKKKKKKKK